MSQAQVSGIMASGTTREPAMASKLPAGAGVPAGTVAPCDGIGVFPLERRYRTRLLSAIGVSLLSAVVSGSQVAPAALSETLRAHLKTDRFDTVSSVRGLPLGVRDALQKLFGSQALDIAVDIAEPGATFQVTGVIGSPRLPIRRLAVAECSIDHCLVYYERGGVAPTWHVAVFHWTPAATRFEFGGTAPGGLATIGDVRKAVLSGAIKGPAKFW